MTFHSPSLDQVYFTQNIYHFFSINILTDLCKYIYIPLETTNKLYFLGFPPPEAAEVRQHRWPSPAGKTYSVCTCSPGRSHCNKLGTQAPRRGMLFLPIL